MPFNHVRKGDSSQLEELASRLARANRVVVITGAGISTSCGIPDFRSQEGLYSLTRTADDDQEPEKKRRAPIKGADLFDSNLFRDEDKTRAFYRFMASLRRECEAAPRTSRTHKFIRKLGERQRLVRCYTQNIDGFESREDMCSELARGPGSRHRMAKKALDTARAPSTEAPGGLHDSGCEVVPLHGDLQTLKCTVCPNTHRWTPESDACFLAGNSPACKDCTENAMIRQALGKRELRSGSLRPNIVLYGEEHPDADVISRIRQNDLNMKPDLLLVMGTSLKVDGLKMLVKEFAHAVHSKKGGKAFFINLTQPAQSVWGEVFDTWVEMACDDWVDDMRLRRKELWQTQTRLDDADLKVVIKNDTAAVGKLEAKCLKSRKRRASDELPESSESDSSPKRRAVSRNSSLNSRRATIRATSPLPSDSPDSGKIFVSSSPVRPTVRPMTHKGAQPARRASIGASALPKRRVNPRVRAALSSPTADTTARLPPSSSSSSSPSSPLRKQSSPSRISKRAFGAPLQADRISNGANRARVTGGKSVLPVRTTRRNANPASPSLEFSVVKRSAATQGALKSGKAVETSSCSDKENIGSGVHAA